MNETYKEIYSIVEEDLKVGIRAYDEGNYNLLNVIGNRISTTLMIGNEKDLILAGFIVKELAREISRIEREGFLDECEEDGRTFLEKIKSRFTQPKVDPEEIWTLYTDYQQKIGDFLRPEIERSVYSKSADYTSWSRKFLLDYLFERKEDLMVKGTNIVRGVTDEFARIINTHKFNGGDLVFYLTLRALDRAFVYLKGDFYATGEGEEKKEEIISYIEKIKELENDNLSIDKLREKSAKIIGELGAKWRKLYMEYGELKQAPSKKPEERVELPKETREKIKEDLIEGLRGEVR